MEFAWNTQKNKLSDVKGKEIEQERKSDNLKNEDIDKSRSDLNYDLIESNLNLYQRVKNRIEEVKENSRIQKNSVVMYSNVITVSKETSDKWGSEKVKEYFSHVTDYFKKEFGAENIVSAKVHLDETAPHMHLHFLPVSEDGKLQAHKIMTKSKINKVHSQAPKYLISKGFDVVRGKGITHKNNIKDIHQYKFEKLKEEVSELEKRKNIILKSYNSIYEVEELKVVNPKVKKSVLSEDKVLISKNEYEYLIDAANSFREALIASNNEILELKYSLDKFRKKENKLFDIKQDYQYRLEILEMNELAFERRNNHLIKKEQESYNYKKQFIKDKGDLYDEIDKLNSEMIEYKKSAYSEIKNEFEDKFKAKLDRLDKLEKLEIQYKSELEKEKELSRIYLKDLKLHKNMLDSINISNNLELERLSN